MIRSYTLAILCAMVVLGNGRRISEDPSQKLLARRTRVIDGGEVSIENIPWQVNFINYWGRSTIPGCSGSIISSNWVITAGHCICSWAWDSLGPLIVLSAGSSHYKKGSHHTIVEVICHPQYYLQDDKDLLPFNDIGLLRVAEPFKFDKTRQPIPLHSGAYEAMGQFEAIASGWGSTTLDGQLSDNLKAATFKVISSLDCLAFLSTVDKNSSAYSAKICAEPLSGSICQGDSGGPLTVNGTLVGIVSWGRSCSAKDGPQVFSEVAHYRDWISEITSL
ncbi:trypsin alpha-4-like [Venturia canescens]|uniref:trypsin alpha-4-like n=1 Tax=Venturia canescens TaxID=32260 RepID=UPI001C9C0DF4|nr:trypsin alpha-4-like [Venturia canescens]